MFDYFSITCSINYNSTLKIVSKDVLISENWVFKGITNDFRFYVLCY